MSAPVDFPITDTGLLAPACALCPIASRFFADTEIALAAAAQLLDAGADRIATEYALNVMKSC